MHGCRRRTSATVAGRRKRATKARGSAMSVTMSSVKPGDTLHINHTDYHATVGGGPFPLLVVTIFAQPTDRARVVLCGWELGWTTRNPLRPRALLVPAAAQFDR